VFFSEEEALWDEALVHADVGELACVCAATPARRGRPADTAAAGCGKEPRHGASRPRKVSVAPEALRAGRACDGRPTPHCDLRRHRPACGE